MKPEPETYELILDRLNAKSKDCLFIDDQEKNLTAAREIGIQTIKFVNAEQLKEDLNDIDILLN